MMFQIHRVFTLFLLTTLLIGCAAQEAAQERKEERSKPREAQMSTDTESPANETSETKPKPKGPALISPTPTTPPETAAPKKDQVNIEQLRKTLAKSKSETAKKKRRSSSTAKRSFKMVAPGPRAPMPAATAPAPSSDTNRALMAATAPAPPAPEPKAAAAPEAPRPMMMLRTETMSAPEAATAAAAPEAPRPMMLFRTEEASAPEAAPVPKAAAVPRAEEVDMAEEHAGDDGDMEEDYAGEDGDSEEAIAEAEEEKDYQVVKVFYGTNRKVAIGVIPDLLCKVPWSLVAMVSGALTIFICILCIFWIRGRKAVFLPLLLLALTLGTGTASVFYPYQGKPAFARTDVAYGVERGEFELGTCEVSIPKTHQLAGLEAPSVFKFEINEDPNKHVVLLGIDRLEEGPFLEDLRETIADSEGKEAFLFIHGYNVTFENAARRTAQLAYDLNFKGAPILYSWPSQGSLLKYTIDEANAEWSVSDLKEFLRLIANQSGARRVHLIAHSMGNRALSSALEKLSYTDAENGPIFNEVILTAPDIDAEVFRRDLAPRIIKTAQRVTLYASSNDEALIASKKVHGSPRAGESGTGVVVVPGIDTIDVSQLDTSLLGHSYYGSNDTVLFDMAQLLLESKPPTLRKRLKTKVLNGLSYWVFFVENLRAGIKEHAEKIR